MQGVKPELSSNTTDIKMTDTELRQLSRRALYEDTGEYVQALRNLDTRNMVTFRKHDNMNWKKPTIKWDERSKLLGDNSPSSYKKKWVKAPAWQQPQDAIFPRMRADNNNHMIKNAAKLKAKLTQLQLEHGLSADVSLQKRGAIYVIYSKRPWETKQYLG